MARNSGRAGLGKITSVTFDEKYLSNSDAEKANRIDTGYPSDKNPADHPTAFKQIPAAQTGKNVNEPTLEHRAGHMKFSDFKG